MRFLQGGPCYLGLHANVAVSVLRVSEKTVLTDTTVLSGSEADSREELAGASLCAGTLSSTMFSVNSSDHSGRSRNKFPVRPRCLHFCWFSVSAGSCDGCPVLRYSYSQFLMMRDAM